MVPTHSTPDLKLHGLGDNPLQDMEALVGEVGRSHADVALELEGRKQREVSRGAAG